jgi:Tol biopolymer transport system component
MTSAGTVAGAILGTAAYMSPEQARGRPLDRRSDVWSFGCVLYEMLTARQTFPGETVSDVIAAILARQPGWDRLPADTDPRIERVLRRCLEKDVRARTRDLGDVALDLREAIEEAPGETVAAPGPSSSSSRVPWPAISALLLVALIASLVWWPRSTGRPGEGTVVPVTEMTPLVDQAGAQHSGALSPDGKRLLFVAEDGGDLDIFLQRVGGENPINLTGNSPEDDFDPVFAPDGERIAFASERDGGGIFVMGATGESPRRVTHAGFDPSWSPDGNSLVYTSERVLDPYSRGTEARLEVVDVESLQTRTLEIGDAVGPVFSPNGHRIAFWNSPGGRRDLWTVAADGGDPVRVTDDTETDWSPFWSPDGEWLYFVSDRGGSPDLWRVSIDERSGKLGGPLQPVTMGVARVWEAAMAAAAPRIVVGINDNVGQLVRLALDPDAATVVGEPVTIHSASQPFARPALSRDGEWIAYQTTGAYENLVIMRSDGSERRQLTDDRHRNRGPQWSPDGRWLTIYSNRNGRYQLWAVRPDGTGWRALTDDPTGINDPTWSPDGRRLAVSLSGDAGRALGFVALPPEGIEGVDAPLAIERGRVISSNIYPIAWSPDGRHVLATQVQPTGEWTPVVYSVDEEGLEVVRDPAGKPIVNFEEGVDWLDAHRVLAADSKTRQVYVYDVRTKTSRPIAGIPAGDFDVATDGRSMIVSRVRQESDVWMLTLGE